MPPDRDSAPRPWRALTVSLGGTFTARVRGLLEPELVLLDATGDPFGRLVPHAEVGATLTAGDARAEIGGGGTAPYEMVADGASLLTAKTAGSPAAVEITASSQTYGADLAILRNRATATTAGGRRIARVEGGLSNRRYEAAFDPDAAEALPVALFLLYRIFTLRSGAYLSR